MPLISKKDADALRDEFAAQLVNPIKLVMFTQTVECQFCAETRQIVEEVAALSDKIESVIYNFVTDEPVAESYGIAEIPAIVILGMQDGKDQDYGIRFYGIPSGYEFSTVVEDILAVSRGESGLKPATQKVLAGLTQPVHIQVFITPTCPYCPQAVHLAHMFALETKGLVQADMVEAIEFPHLANKYQVYGVPRTVINDKIHQEGAVPEPILLAKLLQALAPAPEQEPKDKPKKDKVEKQKGQKRPKARK
ncbi:MAG: thioredoxin family protein [Anaerolineae bacterium]|nr:thioredoxin family protein [Anaerolineae bacterium]